jgi:hypothetical protein
MSSEFEHDRKAVNLYGLSGAYTALFVKSHSSNDDPYEPRWSLYGFTEKSLAMEYVCKYAHYADDGMTKGPGGRAISSEAWVGQWRQALASATTSTHQFSTRMEFFDTNNGNEFPMANLAPLMALAASMGIQLSPDPVVQAERTGSTITINLFDPAHIELIWQATRYHRCHGNPLKETSLDPHRVFKSLTGMMGSFFWTGTPDQKADVTEKRTAKFTLPATMYKVEFPVDGQTQYTDDRVICIGDNDRVLYGARGVLSWFCNNVLPGLEQAQPGCAESAIRSFKKQLKDVRGIPPAHIAMWFKKPINARPTRKPSKWEQEDLDKLWANAKYLVGTGGDLGQIHKVQDQQTALQISHALELYATFPPPRFASKAVEHQSILFA